MKLQFILINLILLTLFSSCTTTTFESNPSLLRPWSQALYEEQDTDESFIATFKRDNKQLVYIAGKHAKNSNDKVFKLIEQKVSSFKPEVIILEGFDPAMSEKRMREIADKCAPNFVKCGESFKAIYLAPDSTKLITGEPSESDIVKELTAKGYSDSDIVYFYLVRQIPQMQRQGNLEASNFSFQAEKYIKKSAKKLRASNFDSAFELFKDWYENKMQENFNLEKIDNETPAPHKNGTYIQHLSYNVGVIRDSNILKVIANEMNNRNRVLILYGSSHFSVQRLALEEMFGKPSYIK